MGCVGITSSFFPDGVISEKRWQRAVLAARMELEPVEVHYRYNWDQAIGSSGTIKTVGNILQAQGWSDEGIRFDSLKKLRDRVLSFPDIKTLALIGLSEERRAVFLGGLVILYAVFEALEIQQMFVSETALREGSLVDLLGRHEHKDVRVDSVNRLKARYKIDIAQSDRVTNSSLKLLAQVANEWELDDPRFESYLGWAAQIHEIGLAISHSQFHKHSAYLVQYSDMPGFSNREQQILSMLVRSHRRKFSSNPFDELPVSYVKKVKRLAFLFRLAVLLNRGRQNRDHPECKLSMTKNEIGIWFPPGWLQENKMVEGDLSLEKSFLAAAGFKLSYQ